MLEQRIDSKDEEIKRLSGQIVGYEDEYKKSMEKHFQKFDRERI